MALSANWPDANAPARVSTFTSNEGGVWTFEEHAEHMAIKNPQGETWQSANVIEDPANPDRLKIAGRWFRAEGA